MHRWQFQRMYSRLAPQVLYMFVLCLQIGGLKRAAGGRAFSADAAYVDMAIAQAIADTGRYAIVPGQDAMAVQDTLWRILLALVTIVTHDPLTAAYLLNAVFGAVTLLLLLEMARRLFPFPPFMLYTAALAALGPALTAICVAGTSASLATMLVLAATHLHIEGMADRRRPLPMLGALLISLAMWIRVEFGWLWLIFMAHALLLNLFRPAAERAGLFLLVRGAAGLLLLALCFLPLLVWNFNLLGVPWPQTAGAPLVVDSLADRSPAELARYTLGLSLDAIPRAFAFIWNTPFLQGWLELILAVFGILFIATLALWRTDERPQSALLWIVVLLPLFYALSQPLLGWESATLVFASLNPLFVLAAAFGIFRIPFFVEQAYRKWKEGLPSATGFNVWWIGMGSLLLLMATWHSISGARAEQRALSSATTGRQAVTQAFETGSLPPGLVVTDAPGWIAFDRQLMILDLRGRLTPEVLTCLDSEGRVDPVEMSAMLDEYRPAALVLWAADNDYAAGLMPVTPVGATGVRPRIFKANWPEVP